jgi:hypothetical protein
MVRVKILCLVIGKKNYECELLATGDRVVTLSRTLSTLEPGGSATPLQKVKKKLYLP